MVVVVSDGMSRVRARVAICRPGSAFGRCPRGLFRPCVEKAGMHCWRAVAGLGRSYIRGLDVGRTLRQGLAEGLDMRGHAPSRGRLAPKHSGMACP
jgi:hypothetical protein